MAPKDRRDTESNALTDAQVRVQLEDGRWLVVSAPPVSVGNESQPTPLTREQLISLAEGVSFDSQPDYGWLGTG